MKAARRCPTSKVSYRSYLVIKQGFRIRLLVSSRGKLALVKRVEPRESFSGKNKQKRRLPPLEIAYRLKK